MKFPTIEIVDRYTIAVVKHKKTNGANQEELDFYIEQMQEVNLDLQHQLILESITIAMFGHWKMILRKIELMDCP